MQTDSQPSPYRVLQNLGHAMRAFPETTFGDALSQGQIQSKQWLVGELEKLDLPLGTVFLLAGWWGLLGSMMFESKLKFEKIRSFDLDPSCAPIADKMNHSHVLNGWKFKASTADITHLNYLKTSYKTKRADGTDVELIDIPNTLINTSCEHMNDFSSWYRTIPNQKLLVLQSNDFFDHSDHIGSVRSLEEFETLAPLNEVFFRGELPLDGYRRFMLIGRK